MNELSQRLGKYRTIWYTYTALGCCCYCYSSSQPNYLCLQLRHFDQGNLGRFFGLWQHHMPIQLQHSANGQKVPHFKELLQLILPLNASLMFAWVQLEFHIQLYFAIFPALIGKSTTTHLS